MMDHEINSKYLSLNTILHYYNYLKLLLTTRELNVVLNLKFENNVSTLFKNIQKKENPLDFLRRPFIFM